MGDITANQLTELFTRFKAGGMAVKGPDHKAGCTALIEMGLRAAKAKSFQDYPQPKDGNYVWGTPITDFDDLQPGDVLQFRDHTFTIKTVTSTGWFKEGPHQRPHHTAFVTRIVRKGEAVEVLEQHVRPNPQKIMANVVYLKSTIIHDAKGAVTTVTMKGKIWAYRPQSK